MKDSGASNHIEVQAFLILERVPGSKEFVISVLLQASGQFIGKTSLGTVAEGKEILLSLRWDKPTQRFVASSQAPGSMPVLSFIPFASHDAAHDVVPPDFSMTKSFALNLGQWAIAARSIPLFAATAQNLTRRDAKCLY